jgi:hypothetical protein
MPRTALQLQKALQARDEQAERENLRRLLRKRSGQDDDEVHTWDPPRWTVSNAQGRIVEGIASTDSIDDQHDIVEASAVEDALPKFMQFGNLRAMHTKVAAGKVLAAKVTPEGLWVRAHRVITRMNINEISLVDRPANSEARIRVVKMSKASGTTYYPVMDDDEEPIGWDNFLLHKARLQSRGVVSPPHVRLVHNHVPDLKRFI